MAYSEIVSWLTQSVAVVLLALWLPATLHCRLENIPGLEFLSCCQHEDAEKTPAHHEQDCANDGCAAVESGFYKQEKPQDAPAKPVLALMTLPGLSLDKGPQDDLVSIFGIFSSPPELAQSWQFSCRTALPPRAPSFVA
jgi:hypothetical protein